MAKARASKGFLVKPAIKPNISKEQRQAWLQTASDGFVNPTPSNKAIYRIILEALWPEGHGIPGPTLTEKEIRDAIDLRRTAQGKPPYKDVFRRLRELQGEEGYTCITKEGNKYQIISLSVGVKRVPREKIGDMDWNTIKKKYGYKCAHCGAQEPDVKLSPDHKVPRVRNGGNELENIQPLCEQCNNTKSSACRGCNLNCFVCPWAFPETHKPIVIDDDNKEQLRRAAEERRLHQSELTNQILRDHFNRNR